MIENGFQLSQSGSLMGSLDSRSQFLSSSLIFVAAVDGEVANGHVCDSADQNLGCDWIAGGQAGSVLHDAAERRHNDRCAQSSALNASEGQRFFDSTYSG